MYGSQIFPLSMAWLVAITLTSGKGAMIGLFGNLDGK
jgi:hypothetical protein